MEVERAEAYTRLSLAAVLTALAMLKIASGYNPDFSTPRIAYWVFTVTELVLASFVLSKQWRGAAYATIVVSVGAVLHWFVFGSTGKTCGCAGDVELWAGRTPLVLAAVLGMLSSACLISSRRRERAP